MKKIFRKKAKSSERRHVGQDSRRVHSYYTPVQQERIEIDMASRRGKQKAARTGMLRHRFEAVMGVVFVMIVLYLTLVLRGTPLLLVDAGSTGIDESRYAARVEQLFNGSILNTNKVTLQRSSIRSKLLEEFPELSDVEVRSSFVGRRPEVYMSVEDIPFTYEALGTVYAVSTSGKNIGLLSTLPTLKQSIYIRDESGIATKKGDTVLRASDVQFITSVKEYISQKARRVEYVRLTDVQREVYVKLADVNYEIRMYLDDNPGEEVGTFLAAEKTLGEGGEVPSRYIDVRAGEKVFWQ